MIIKANTFSPQSIRFYDCDGAEMDLQVKSCDIKLRPDEGITAVMEVYVNGIELDDVGIENIIQLDHETSQIALNKVKVKEYQSEMIYQSRRKRNHEKCI